MWLKAVLLTVLTTFSVAVAQAEVLLDFRGIKIDVPVSPAYVACFKSADGNDLDMARCTQAETKLWDRRLNSAYTTLRTKLTKSDFAVLQSFQRAWIADRDATCRDTGQNGTLGRLAAAGCEMRIVILRTVELELRAAEGS